MQLRELGVVGLGRMGGGLALQALQKGMRVVGYTLGGPSSELLRAGLVQASSLEELVRALAPPRAVLLYIPAGPAVDEALERLAAAAAPKDVLADGGNSYWGDSIWRARRLAARGIHLLDVGTSGGVEGARTGACFMVGGDPIAVARMEPILRELAVENGYVHAGPSGAGHFTKLVHNGIEFGMLQALGEGVALLESFRDQLPVADVLRCWRHGSVIRSWLLDLLEEEYRARRGLAGVSSHVEDTGEVNWLVSDALELEIPVPVIAQAVMALLSSRDAAKTSARAVAVVRRAFGMHPLGPSAFVARERREGRVGKGLREKGKSKWGD
jgi:6-phosphogluconate dehydrogenase